MACAEEGGVDVCFFAEELQTRNDLQTKVCLQMGWGGAKQTRFTFFIMYIE